ncbi:MAG: hypothetical protein ACREPZ_06490 [Rhodanobacteraceae bacterium]
MSRLRAFALILAAGLLAACSHGDGNDRNTSVFQHLSIAGNGDIIAHARDGGSARVSAAGDLGIGGKAVVVTSTQRRLLQSYHADTLTLLHDAIAIGKAGMQTGLHALGAVAKGLASGDTDSIDSEVNGRANKVNALGHTMCQDLARLYATQGQVAAAIPAFGPYATIEPHEVSDCHVD